jgi:hypothetical protein
MRTASSLQLPSFVKLYLFSSTTPNGAGSKERDDEDALQETR